MTDPKDSLPKVPPFLKPEPPHKNGVDMRGMLSLVTMLVSLAALTLSMGGAAKLVFDVFGSGLEGSLPGLFVKVVVLGFAFFFGWGVGLVCIRGFGNLIYPIIINIYAWGCLIAVSVLYLEVMMRLYYQKYDGLHFWAYLITLLGGLFVLIFLHLLMEGHDLRPFAIPLLIISVVQIFVIVYRYVFTQGANGMLVLGDFTIFIMMISISALMLMHIGLLSPFRDWIDGMFLTRSENESE